MAITLSDPAAPPRTTVIAVAVCEGCNWVTHATHTCRERALAHRDETGHRVSVIETTTTSYEAPSHA